MKTDRPQHYLSRRTFEVQPLNFGTGLQRPGPHLDSHVGVGEDHVEVFMCHAELFPQLCDQILVHHVLLTKTLHWLVIFWTKQKTDRERYHEGLHIC